MPQQQKTDSEFYQFVKTWQVLKLPGFVSYFGKNSFTVSVIQLLKTSKDLGLSTISDYQESLVQ